MNPVRTQKTSKAMLSSETATRVRPLTDSRKVRDYSGMNPVRTQKTSKAMLSSETATRVRPSFDIRNVKWVLTG